MSKPMRSDKYQNIYNEIGFDMTSKEAFWWSEDRALYAIFQEDEEIEFANDLVIQRLFEIVPPHLTQNQLTVFNYIKDGLSQTEISKAMGYSLDNNSVVHKLIHGTQAKKSKVNGGLGKRIIKICLADEMFRQACLNLYNCDGGGSMLHLTLSWHDNLKDWLDWLKTPLDPIGLPVTTVEEIMTAFRNAKIMPKIAINNKRKLQTLKLAKYQTCIVDKVFQAYYKGKF